MPAMNGRPPTTLNGADRILAQMAEGLPNGVVPAEIYGNDELYRRELEKIFARIWVFLGHETEIPHKGDFVSRYIGEDKFILIRGEDEKIRALLDFCSHRGARVCRSDKGNASSFTCPYHGWTYNNQGDLVGIPLLRQAYTDIDKSKWSLKAAPRVEILHGLIFACLDEKGPSLDEHLGGMKWYLDLIFGLGEGGMEVLGAPHRWIVDANWKVGGDNFAGDDYHTIGLHKSMFDINSLPIDPIDNMKGYHVQAGNGHCVSLSMPDKDDPQPLEFLGYPKEVAKLFEKNSLTTEQVDIARRLRVGVGTVYPNLSFLTLPAVVDPAIPLTPFMSLRQWQPAGPNKMEVWSWQLTWKNAPPDFKKHAYRVGATTFGSAGTFEQDDTVPWEHISRNARSVFARKVGARLNYEMGLEGRGSTRIVDDWAGPGVAVYPRWEDGNQRHFHSRYLELMTAGEEC